jgi:uncharacterized membrane protein YcaP (DUF421 family)
MGHVPRLGTCGSLPGTIHLLGKRISDQWTPVDFIAGISIGCIAGSATLDSRARGRGLLGRLSVSERSPVVAGRTYRSLSVGQPIPGVTDGRVKHRALSRMTISEETLKSLMRSAKAGNLRRVKTAKMEPGGKLSITKRPKNPS